MIETPPDLGIYVCSGCMRSFTGPGNAEAARRHVRRCALLHGAFFFSFVALLATMLVLHAMGKL